PLLADEHYALAPIGNFTLSDELRALAAVVPSQLEGRQLAAHGELIADDQPRRRGFGIDRRPFRFDRQRVAELQRPEGEVHVVTGHVAEDTLAEIPPVPPDLRGIRRVIRP